MRKEKMIANLRKIELWNQFSLSVHEEKHGEQIGENEILMLRCRGLIWKITEYQAQSDDLC